MFEDWTQAQGREESESAKNDHYADQKRSKQRRTDREGAGRWRDALFLREIAGNGENRDEHEESAAEHVPTEDYVVPPCIRIQAGEGRSVVASA